MKNNFWDTLSKWLAPGMNVKRWIILTLFGISLLGLSAMVLVDSTYLGIIKRFAINLMIDVFGKNRLYTPDWISYLLGFSVLVLGMGSFVYGIKKLLDSIIKSLLPEREKEIADIVREYRFRNKLLNIVVIGGGTGIFPFLQALRDLPFSVTAIVTVADSGGSSGRLRDEFSIPAPGDIRRALIALSPGKASELETLFNYRYKEGSLKDHTVGNLMIAGLTEMCGDFSEAIYQLSKILAIKGKVIPFTLNNLTLCAEFDDGTTVMGEAEIHKCHKRIRRIFFDPPYCKPLLRVIEEIDKADVIMMGPGSLYTSVLPCLIITPIADIIARSEALKIYNANLMTEVGETDGYSVTEHLQALFENVNAKVADYVLINQGKIDPGISGTYAKYNAVPVSYQIESIRKLGVTPLLADLVNIQDGLIRHSPDKVALAIVDLVNKTRLIRGKKFRL